MKIIHFQKKVPDALWHRAVVIGIGKFDGFHLGHQKVVRAIIDTAKEKKLIPAVFTFRNFPAEFYLYPWEERIGYLKKAGIELCIWSDFEEIKMWKPDKFLQVLKKDYKVSCVIVGKNFRFGSHRKGDDKFLSAWAEENNVSAAFIEPVIIRGQPVSSSRIRFFIKRGSVHTVYQMTGRYFSVRGEVIKGIGLGKKIGVPTANLNLANKIPLSSGVYVAVIEFKNKCLRGIAYYGSSPTVSVNQQRFEVHIFDFSRDIYGETLTVYLVKKIRAEKIFSSAETLKIQIEKDIHTAQEFNC